MPERKALDEAFPGTRHQRCWVHKTTNVLNKFPKSMHPAVKADLRDIWQAETRAAAEAAMDTFAESWRDRDLIWGITSPTTGRSTRRP